MNGVFVINSSIKWNDIIENILFYSVFAASKPTQRRAVCKLEGEDER